MPSADGKCFYFVMFSDFTHKWLIGLSISMFGLNIGMHLCVSVCVERDSDWILNFLSLWFFLYVMNVCMDMYTYALRHAHKHSQSCWTFTDWRTPHVFMLKMYLPTQAPWSKSFQYRQPAVGTQQATKMKLEHTIQLWYMAQKLGITGLSRCFSYMIPKNNFSRQSRAGPNIQLFAYPLFLSMFLA